VHTDLEDDHWRFLYLFQRTDRPDGTTLFTFAGFISIYEYWAYPSNVRPRIRWAVEWFFGFIYFYVNKR
jgi:histone acetyltransferase 1